MTQNPSASAWATARGDQWLAQLSGMERMLEPIDEPLIRALALDRALRIAEVGSGGGGTSLEILRRAPAGSVLHGFDISSSLVELARERARSEPNARFEVADMAKATAEQPYQRLVSRFGIMFFDEPEAAFSNLARWLEPGGRFAFAVWASPSENAWLSRTREVVSRFVELPALDREAPGPFRYADASKLRALLEHSGFGEIELHGVRDALPLGGGPAAAAEFALAAFSSFAELLAQAGDATRDEALRALASDFSSAETGGVVKLAASVHLIRGVRR